MTKPLELTVYPHVTDGGIDCIIDREGTMRIPRECDDFAASKHLTDAELAAEWWRLAEMETDRHHFRMNTTHITDQLRTVRRFALAPHASENGYE